MRANRVIFHVRCHGEPDEDIEQQIIEQISDAVTYPAFGWGILTIGRSYYHDKADCPGHPDAEDNCVY